MSQIVDDILAAIPRLRTVTTEEGALLKKLFDLLEANKGDAEKQAAILAEIELNIDEQTADIAANTPPPTE